MLTWNLLMFAYNNYVDMQRNADMQLNYLSILTRNIIQDLRMFT